MNDLHDSIAQILADWKVSTATPSQGADAIIDAMPSMVSQLVWMRNGNHWAGGYGCVVRKIGAMYVMTVRNKHDRQFEALDEAKAAAQAHHVATILSAFGVQG